ncbi:MAG: hypothetical protein A3F70_10825 [Acidobacteria bacterium RIFCSPLOWO2_12_FULL_67_14]|nr:MAG: hypothetical protein A3H29_11060 [Acidobacteria bacterium RIFCSPLOWO2_02_FULL_67_21]OFW35290.1 MAG: hypothetical protein A3F70_10825 [Acidobacteria bacterium RIFCSPLOWO2_12_FULL_67_14]
MPPTIRAAALLLAVVLSPVPLSAQAPRRAPSPATAQEPPGKEILSRKCFQCHAMSMWTSLRQDRKQWEAVLYRMVGRGALWTEAEINAMADYLAELRGPQVNSASAKSSGETSPKQREGGPKPQIPNPKAPSAL